MAIGNEHIYYTVTSSSTIKFGRSANISSRQGAHYSSSPFLQMHTYRVNDSYLAERELHKAASEYKIMSGDIIDGVEITHDCQAEEHYLMDETTAKLLCETIQKKYCWTKPLNESRTYCVGCNHVVNISTINRYDGFRCKRCYEKIFKTHAAIQL